MLDGHGERAGTTARRAWRSRRRRSRRRRASAPHSATARSGHEVHRVLLGWARGRQSGVPVTGSSTTWASRPKTSRDEGDVDDVAGSAGRVDAPVAHRDELIRVAAGLVDVVQHHHDGPAALVRRGRRAGRARRPGGRGRGTWSARRAAAARSAARAPSRSTRAGAGRRRARRARARAGRSCASPPAPPRPPPRRRPTSPEQALVRIPPARGEVLDGQALGRDRRLRQQPEPARDLLRRQLGDRAPVEQHAARGAASSSRASARSSVDLPQPLAPTIAVIRAAGRRGRSPSMTSALAVADAQPACLEAAHAAARRSR